MNVDANNKFSVEDQSKPHVLFRYSYLQSLTRETITSIVKFSVLLEFRVRLSVFGNTWVCMNSK